MRHKDHGRSNGLGDDDKQSNVDDPLDAKLKELGAEFLDDEVPEALLDVLRRGMGQTSGSARSTENALQRSKDEQPHDKKEK